MKDMKDYLSLSPDELDFYSVLKKDKRTFCEFLINIIVKKQIIVKTFFIVEETIPLNLKIILFTLYLDLHFLVISFILSAEDISMPFHLNLKEYIIYQINKFPGKIIISITITSFLNFLMKSFFVNKNSIKSVIKREKNDLNQLKIEMNEFLKNIKIRYILFIVLDLIIILISWYCISAFNIMYPNTKIIWLILVLITILIEQIVPVIFALLEACLRFIAIKLKINAIFELSKYINSL